MKARTNGPLDPASALPALGEVLEFLRLVWAVDHGLQRRSRQMEMTIGITSPQRLVLRVVGRFPGIPAGQLARLLHVHPGTLTGIVKRLERQGLLRRRADPRDGRRALLGLTERGRKLDFETEGLVESAVRATLDETPPAALAAARDVLERLSARLTAAAPSPLTARSDSTGEAEA